MIAPSSAQLLYDQFKLALQYVNKKEAKEFMPKSSISHKTP
ncbi:MAG TPA: hypothetical protein PK581_01810 [Caldisericia bacterium]|nr:hypothetical protein [Caldisericia bacterium]